METKFKMEKFHRGDSGFSIISYRIRHEILPSKKIIVFCIKVEDLSNALRFGDKIDFDKESDAIIEKHSDSKNNMTFEYVPNIGFDEVDINQQKWFIFN